MIKINITEKMIIHWLVNTLAIIITAYLLPGIHVESFRTALAIAIVLAIVNTIIKPVLLLITLPLTIITLGLFILIINAFLILITANIVHGFVVDNFWWALAFSVILYFVNSTLYKLIKT